MNDERNDDHTPTEYRRVCPECDGEGAVFEPPLQLGAPGVMVRCPTCHGTGQKQADLLRWGAR